MKRWIAMLMSILMLFGLASCAPAPETPGETGDLVYDMKNYAFFSQIFEEKSVEELLLSIVVIRLRLTNNLQVVVVFLNQLIISRLLICCLMHRVIG